MFHENPLFRDQKVKGQGHNVCVDLQTERYIAAAADAYVSYARFSMLQCPAAHATPATPRVFPASLLRVCLPLGFPRRMFLRS